MTRSRSNTVKKIFIPAVVLAIIALIPIGIWAAKSRQSPATQEPTTPARRKTSKPVNEIPMTERPYVVMTPTNNREIQVTVKTLNKPADGVEFLAEYQYGTSLGGNENFIQLASLPATKEFALYSRSAGGKTSYEEDVKGGTLTLKFQGTEEYWLKQDWNYYDRVNAKSSTKESVITSRDGKFGITNSTLPGVRYAILYMSPGYPSQLPGAALSDLYTIQFAGAPTVDTLSISVRMKEASKGKIYGWTGSEWKAFETTVNDQVATADVDILESYIVVSN